MSTVEQLVKAEEEARARHDEAEHERHLHGDEEAPEPNLPRLSVPSGDCR